jgi:16S rRNA (uracil1498-N3)-methyltransferase
MRRFFIDPDNFAGSSAFLTGSEAHHISSVLRLSTGTIITLFDGTGSFYEAQITKISAKRIETVIQSITPYIKNDQEQPAGLHLAQALIKGKKMDFIIQKATELGVDSISPFRSAFCAVKQLPENRFDRWSKIALEACKQCNRPKPPAILPAAGFSDFLESIKKNTYDLKLFFWEEEVRNSLYDLLQQRDNLSSVMMLIGPEGGFSSDEAELAIADGFMPVTLGSRMLRAETAAIAAISILQYELGNLT